MGVEKSIFGLKQVQDMENRDAHPHQEHQGVTPPPPLPGLDFLPIGCPQTIFLGKKSRERG